MGMFMRNHIVRVMPVIVGMGMIMFDVPVAMGMGMNYNVSGPPAVVAISGTHFAGSFTFGTFFFFFSYFVHLLYFMSSCFRSAPELGPPYSSLESDTFTKAGISFGFRLVTRFPSSTTSWSRNSAPAFLISWAMDFQPVAFRPRSTSAVISS